MVMVMSVVPRDVLNTINEVGEVYSRNRDNENNFNYRPYQMLADLSGHDNFFFGAVNSILDGMADYSLASTREENTELLVMDIPEEELHCTSFRGFERYLDQYIHADLNGDVDRIESLNSHWKDKLTIDYREGFCQGTFPRIRKEWVIAVYDRFKVIFDEYETERVNSEIEPYIIHFKK